MKNKAPIKFFAGRATTYLARKIIKSFGAELGKTSVLEFSDGEFQPYYEESVRGCTVFIIQSTFPPSDNLLELLLKALIMEQYYADYLLVLLSVFKLQVTQV